MALDAIHIEDYDYPLPEDRIAKYPLSQRDASKLLVYREDQSIETRHFVDLPSLLPSDTLLVCNDTKVIHARLHFFKETGARIEIFCLEPLEPSSYELSLAARRHCVWQCMVGNAKKWKDDQALVLQLPREGQKPLELRATLLGEKTGETRQVAFDWEEPCSFAEVLDLLGELPIPPYLNRKTEQNDFKTYQTVYASHEGSVAAPTAGLHFTDHLLSELEKKGIQQCRLTLHVGAGTFKPVKSSLIQEHEMHREVISVSRDSLESIVKALGKITAVGTTSTRTLESLYYMGVHVLRGEANPFYVEQWEPYESAPSYSTEEALKALLQYMDQHCLEALHGATRIIIVPGFRYRLVKRLITNFHQPHSTLLLLIAAFVGKEKWRDIYNYALHHDFRFLSYGDSSLLLRP